VIGPSQSYLPDSNQHSNGRTPTTAVGFEAAIPARERHETHALERAATGIGVKFKTDIYYVFGYIYIYIYIYICVY